LKDRTHNSVEQIEASLSRSAWCKKSDYYS